MDYAECVIWLIEFKKQAEEEAHETKKLAKEAEEAKKRAEE